MASDARVSFDVARGNRGYCREVGLPLASASTVHRDAEGTGHHSAGADGGCAPRLRSMVLWPWSVVARRGRENVVDLIEPTWSVVIGVRVRWRIYH
ncbi:hypothetical protein DV20_12250 [Amycolatopsis rifamycinica]|uniref:Uncharacterized protein n=1 Tax=Amycolatopsis rifamycinica TaxID=287986 RepID=A0A066U4Y1_9PSEU|nr:hypothetical protein DV20_12250 [Amycolatopsis rifamycinica]